MTATTSTGAPQVLTAAGPSLPVPISLDSQRATLPPGIFVQCSPDANLTGFIELSCDHPDAAGNLPTPGCWVPWLGTANLHDVAFSGQIVGPATQGLTLTGLSSLIARLDVTCTAIRFNVKTFTAGSVVFGVSQNRVPDGAGYYKPVPA